MSGSSINGENSANGPSAHELDAPSFLTNISDIMDGFMVSSMNNDEYTVVHITNGFERIFGHGLAVFIARGANYAALIHPDDLGAVSEAVKKALLRNDKWQIQYRLKTASGQWREVRETGAGRSNDGKPVEYMDCIITDIAQMHDMENRLLSGGASIESIGRSVKSIVTLLDTLRMLSLNARIEAALVPEGVGFNEVAKEMADLANTGDGLAKGISTQLRNLDRVLRHNPD